MNNFFTQLKDRARIERLSPNEKQAMRVRLYNHLEQNPMTPFAAPAPVARPVPSTFFFYSSVFSARYMVPLALMLIVGLGSGTAFAAQDSLPGDVLYPVKINVNESVAVALATSPVAKAEVNATLATTRLEEAESLAANGKLDANKAAALTSNFTAHALAAQAVTLAIQSNDPGKAAQLGTDFNSTLAAHGAILTQIGDDSKSDETMQTSNSLAIEVRHEANKGNHEDHPDATQTDALAIADSTVPPQATPAATPASSSGVRIAAYSAMVTIASDTVSSSTGAAAQSTTTPAPKLAKAKVSNKGNNQDNNNSGSSTTDDAKVTASLSAQASSSIAAMQNDFKAIQNSLDATTSAQVDAQIAALQAQYAQGNYVTAIRTAIKLDVFFKAGKKINIKLLSGLLDQSGN